MSHHEDVASLEEERSLQVDLEPQDDGEVLLLKINRLKQELRGCEEQFKATTSKDTSKGNNAFTTFQAPNQTKKNPRSSITLNDFEKLSAAPAGKSSTSNGLDAYELLEEKQRLAGGISLLVPTTGSFAPEKIIENSTHSKTTQSGMTDTTCPISEASRMSSEPPWISTNANDEALKHYAAAPRYDDATLKIRADAARSDNTGSNREGEDRNHRGTNNIADATPAVLRRNQPVHGESLPGAVSVDGLDASSFTRNGTIRIGENAIDEEIVTNDEIGDRTGDIDQVPVAAKVVENEENGMLVSAPLVTAKRDPWYRRNQWWLAGAVVLVTAAIVLSITLTTVNRNTASAPTMSPTTDFEGVEAVVEAVVVAAFPAAANSISSESTSQAEALRWISKQTSNDPTKFSDSRILQQYALATLFLSTLGDSTWVQSDGWMNNTDECGWYGVECAFLEDGSDEQVVVGLKLSENNVSGTIPPDLSILSAGLSCLDLSQNGVGGVIPSTFGLLSSLKTVDLSHNRLESSIPSSIEALSMLERFDVSSNGLTGSIPSEIEMLTMLRSLEIAHNFLVENIPSEIGRLSRLESLSFEFNKLSSPIPSEIGRLTMLELFDGRGNSLVGPFPSEIGSLRHLEVFQLSDNLIFGPLPNQVSLLTNLTVLDLSSNLLTGLVPETIGLLTALTSLDLSDNSLVNLLPDSVALMQKLLYLDVSENVKCDSFLLTNEVKPQPIVPSLLFERMSNLISLNLGGMCFDGPPTSLLSLTKLEVLRLPGSNLGSREAGGSGDIIIDRLLFHLTTLREMDLSSNAIRGGFVSDFGLLTNLEVLDLSGNVVWGEFGSTFESLTNLSVLNIRGNNFGGSIPPEIFGLSKLVHLNLEGFSPGNALSGSIPSSIGLLTDLRYLNLGFTALSGSIPTEIGLTQLEELHLHETSIIGSIPTQIKSLIGLRRLDLHGTALSGRIVNIGIEFQSMEMLNLSSTLVSGSIPDGLWSMSNLIILDLSIEGLSGSIPSELGLMSRLRNFALSSVNLAGSKLPSEIGSLIGLQTMDLTGTSLSGTIPSQLFQCSQLTSLRLGGSSYTGTIPSEIGLTTNLRYLQISDASITGPIPSEIGNLRLLNTLDLAGLSLSGSIPMEISDRLFFLEHLNLQAMPLSGSIPSQLFGISSLRSLSLAHTDLTGATIPPEIALLANLDFLDISYANIGGTVPSELMSAPFLFDMDFRGNQLTGVFPQYWCNFEQFTDNGVYFVQRQALIDCGTNLFCECCCWPSAVPSLSMEPSSTSPTPQPSMSIPPTSLPSLSVTPSFSISPSVYSACSSFSPIAQIGTSLFRPQDSRDEGFFLVDLPFAFNWRGQVEYSTVSVSPNGVIYLGDLVNCPIGLFCVFPNPCCGAIFVGGSDVSGHPRIAVAQEDLIFPLSASIYNATVGDAFVISFEGAQFFGTGCLVQSLNFQVALYANGNVEMRWGEGDAFSTDDCPLVLWNETVAAGIEDPFVAVPVTGAPFDDRGVTDPNIWPTNQCRLFVLTSTDGNYTELF